MTLDDSLASLSKDHIVLLKSFRELSLTTYYEIVKDLFYSKNALKTLELDLKKLEQSNGFDMRAFALGKEIASKKIDISHKEKSIIKESRDFRKTCSSYKNFTLFYNLLDLAAKGLIVDVGLSNNVEPFEYFEITQLGFQILDNLK